MKITAHDYLANSSQADLTAAFENGIKAHRLNTFTDLSHLPRDQMRQFNAGWNTADQTRGWFHVHN